MQYKWGQLSVGSQPQQKLEETFKLPKGGLYVTWHLNYGSTKNQRLCPSKTDEEVTPASLSNSRSQVKTDQGQSSMTAGWERYGTKKRKQNKKKLHESQTIKLKKKTPHIPPRRNKSATQHLFVHLFFKLKFPSLSYTAPTNLKSHLC